MFRALQGASEAFGRDRRRQMVARTAQAGRRHIHELHRLVEAMVQANHCVDGSGCPRMGPIASFDGLLGRALLDEEVRHVSNQPAASVMNALTDISRHPHAQCRVAQPKQMGVGHMRRPVTTCH